MQCPAVRKTRADTSVPEQNSPQVAFRSTRIAPTFGCAESEEPQVIAGPGAARIESATMARIATRPWEARRLRGDGKIGVLLQAQGWPGYAINLGSAIGDGPDVSRVDGTRYRVSCLRPSRKRPVVSFPQEVT